MIDASVHGCDRAARIALHRASGITQVTSVTEEDVGFILGQENALDASLFSVLKVSSNGHIIFTLNKKSGSEVLPGFMRGGPVECG